MIVLCVFEFTLWARADSLSAHELANQAKILGFCEILVGLVNLPTFICGIIVLINAGKVGNVSW
jgi:hypothetical protein